MRVDLRIEGKRLSLNDNIWTETDSWPPLDRISGDTCGMSPDEGRTRAQRPWQDRDAPTPAAQGPHRSRSSTSLILQERQTRPRKGERLAKATQPRAGSRRGSWVCGCLPCSGSLSSLSRLSPCAGWLHVIIFCCSVERGAGAGVRLLPAHGDPALAMGQARRRDRPLLC